GVFIGSTTAELDITTSKITQYFATVGLAKGTGNKGVGKRQRGLQRRLVCFRRHGCDRPEPRFHQQRQHLFMTEITRILFAIEQGQSQAAELLLPLVYDELRKLAAQKLAQEKPGQTLEPTALVHEAYVRLLDAANVPHWTSRAH